MSVSIAFLAAVGPEAYADNGFGEVNYFNTTYVPSNVAHNLVSPTSDDVVCYEVGTQIMLDCPFTFAVLGLASNLPADGFVDPGYAPELVHGGHTHTTTASRLFGYSSNEADQLSLVGTSVTAAGSGCTAALNQYYPKAKVAGNLCISGQTKNKIVQVQLQLPETAGLLAGIFVIKDPDGYHCVGTCYDFNHSIDIEIFRVGAFYYGYADTRFIRVNQDDFDWTIIDNSDDHTDGFYTYGSYLDITNDSYLRFLGIAQTYHGLSSKKLSVNDMSLPLGGLYDVDANWKVDATGQTGKGHVGHRDGIAFDVNRADIDGTLVPCLSDKMLKNAVYAKLGKDDVPGVWTKLYCEGGGRKHVNLYPTPVFNN